MVELTEPRLNRRTDVAADKQTHGSQEHDKGGTMLTRREFVSAAAVAALGAKQVLTSVAGADPSDGSGGMKYRQLGKTGISVSEIGYGSHVNRQNMDDPQARSKQIARALELGVNLFDIYDHEVHQYAPMRDILRPVRKDVVVSLVSIVRHSNIDWLAHHWDDFTAMENWREGTAREVEYALKKLDTDVIDLFRVFVPTEESWAQVEPRYEALLKAKAQGKIRAVGLVSHDQAQLVPLLQTVPGVDFVMFPYNFRHQRLTSGFAPPAGKGEGGIRDCVLVQCSHPEFAQLVGETGVGLLAMKPFGGGGLLKLGASDPRLRAQLDDDVSVSQAALKFILQTPQISSTIPAMNSIAEVEENVAAVHAGGLSESESRCLRLYDEAAERSAGRYLPPEYQWLEQWKG